MTLFFLLQATIMLLARFSVLGSFIRPDPVQTHHGMTVLGYPESI